MALGWYPVWMPVTVGYHRGLSWDSSCFTSLSMTRRRQQKALLWSLQMSQNWGGGGRPVDRLEGQAGMDAVSHRWEQSCAALYKQKKWYKMYRSFSASSSSLVYSAALLVSSCILFSLFLQVGIDQCQGPGNITPQTYLYFSFHYVTVSLPVPQAPVNLIKSFSDWNPILPKL